MRVLYLLLVILTASLLASCNMMGTRDRPEAGLINKYKEIVGNATLTDADIQAYCRAYKALRQQGPNLLQDITDNPEGGQAGYDDVVGTITANGFADYASFVKINAKVAWAWNVYQATSGMDGFEQRQREGEAQMQAMIDDPNVPEEAKVELRKGLAELRANWERNAPWANVVMDRIRPLTNDADMAVVRRNEAILMEAFTGYPPDMFKTHFEAME